MARGDYVDITYRTGAGVTKERIQCRGAGSEVQVKMPDRGELFVIVTEWNAGTPPKPLRTARFAASEVVSIIEGHDAVSRQGKK